jgi:DNA polymerase-3 subunit delta'
VQTAQSWQAYDLMQIMNQLQLFMHNMLKSVQCETTQAIQTRVDYQICWQIIDCIIATTKLVSSQNNANKTLLIEEFLVKVMRLVQPDN